jgi:hypothetical protein
VGTLFDCAHSTLMKQPVAPQSMRAYVHRLTAVSVDSISTSMASDIDPGLDAITYMRGNRCSQARRQLRQLGMGGWEMVCMTFALSIFHITGSIVVSTCRHAYRLCINSGRGHTVHPLDRTKSSSQTSHSMIIHHQVVDIVVQWAVSASVPRLATPVA